MTGPGAIEKPTVFLSHAVTDQPIAQVIHDEIHRIFADGVNVFASSVPGVLQPGSDWLEDIRSNLSAARAVIVIVTPVSINRPWVWFEVGASWSRMLEGEGKIIPLCVPEVDKGSLPEPLGRLQAMSLGSAAETRAVFQALIDQFEFGRIKGFRHASIKAKLPKYGDLRVAEADLRDATFYDGPYEGYSRDELVEVVDDEILTPAWNETQAYRGQYSTNILNGQLAHFRQLDERHALPPGTSRELLVAVAEARYPVTILQRSHNTVRIQRLWGEE